MSRGRKLVPEIEFSTAGINHAQPHLELARHDHVRERQARSPPPPMSFFMLSMPVSGLMSSPPVSKHTPLPTSVIFGSLSLPQVMSISRGARAEPAPTACDQREILARARRRR